VGHQLGRYPAEPVRAEPVVAVVEIPLVPGAKPPSQAVQAEDRTVLAGFLPCVDVFDPVVDGLLSNPEILCKYCLIQISFVPLESVKYYIVSS
jgi:hypothetical protein